MIKVINDQNTEVNFVHFQGQSQDLLKNMFDFLYDNIELITPLDKEISLVSCWTNDSKCVLYNQLKKFNIKLINALPKDYDLSQKWDMRNKIYFYIDCIEKLETKYVLLLDGYDVLMTSTENILEKFKESKYKIIFNTTYNNYPAENIDIIKNREDLGFFKYFNAGCCIGYRKSLIKFYKECLNYINIPNPKNSEQKILRHCFANYSHDKRQKFIWVDYNRSIFHTMAYTNPIYDKEKNIVQILNQNIPNENKLFPISGKNLKNLYQEYNKEFTNINYIITSDNKEINRLLSKTISISGKLNWLQIKVPKYDNNIDIYDQLLSLKKIQSNITISLLDNDNKEFFRWEFKDSIFLGPLICSLDLTNKKCSIKKETLYLSFSYAQQKSKDLI